MKVVEHVAGAVGRIAEHLDGPAVIACVQGGVLAEQHNSDGGVAAAGAPAAIVTVQAVTIPVSGSTTTWALNPS